MIKLNILWPEYQQIGILLCRQAYRGPPSFLRELSPKLLEFTPISKPLVPCHAFKTRSTAHIESAPWCYSSLSHPAVPGAAVTANHVFYTATAPLTALAWQRIRMLGPIGPAFFSHILHMLHATIHRPTIHHWKHRQLSWCLSLPH